jgi:hypothetical protein
MNVWRSLPRLSLDCSQFRDVRSQTTQHQKRYVEEQNEEGQSHLLPSPATHHDEEGVRLERGRVLYIAHRRRIMASGVLRVTKTVL